MKAKSKKTGLTYEIPEGYDTLVIRDLKGKVIEKVEGSI